MQWRLAEICAPPIGFCATFDLVTYSTSGLSADRFSARLIRDTQKSSRPLIEIARVGFLDQTAISPRTHYSATTTLAAETGNGGASMLPPQEKEKHGRRELSLSRMPQDFDGGMTIGCCCATHQS
jgi:hypothetical protein